MKRLFLLGVLAGTLAAQIRIDQNRNTLQLAAVSLLTQRNLSQASAEVKAEVDKLIVEARGHLAANRNGEARRSMARASARLQGREWNPKEEYASSLVLRTSTAVTDPGRPLIVTLTQVFPAQIPAPQGIRLTASLHRLEGQGPVAKPGAVVRDFGIFEAVSKDLIEEPYTFDIDLTGIADGVYVLVAAPMDFYETVRELGMRIAVVSGLDRTRGDLEQRLKKINGRESAKATVRYPFDLARQVNTGRREFANLDYTRQIAKSAEILKSLEAGQDPVAKSKGDQKRHYYLAQADEIMPYRVYVPAKWTPTAKLPLVIALHGLGGNEDSLMSRDDGMLMKLAEQHGMIVAAPLGYRSNGGYGNGITAQTDPSRARLLQLSEADVMNVAEMVEKEYGADPKRRYLMGHSMGGAGTWFLGGKHAGRFTKMATIAAPAVNPETYPFAKLKDVPIFVAHGDQDPTVAVSASRTMMEKAKAAGLSPEYMEAAGANHSNIVPQALPRIFDFFAK